MKKIYLQSKLELVLFSPRDVVTSSDMNADDGDGVELPQIPR